MKVVGLATSSALALEEMNKLVTELGNDVAFKKCIGVVTVSIFSDGKFSTRMTGDMTKSRLAGYLSRVWMDAVEAMKA